MRTARMSLWSALAMAGACSTSPGEVENVRLPIVGGTDAATCAWPAVVLVGDDCSGTLVHPQVVVTAAHCVDGKLAPKPKTVSFGEKALNNPVKTVNISRCAASPKYNGGDTDDIGYCLLEQAVTDVPIAPVMAACEASALKAGVAIVEVGFGQSVTTSSANDGFGVKRLIPAKIDAVRSNGQINVTTGNQNGEYYGDSGGPIFFQMPDKTWRFIGDDCCAPDIIEGSSAPRISTYISAPSNLAWLESSSGVDLSICHDGSTWSPGALCNLLPTTPDKASGGWASMCSAQNQVAPQPTCSASGGSGASGAGGKGGSANGGGGSANGGGSGSASGGGGSANGGGGAAGSSGSGMAGASGGSVSGNGGRAAGGASDAGAMSSGGSGTNTGGASGAGGSSSASGGNTTGGNGGGSAGLGGNNQGGIPGSAGLPSTGGVVTASGGVLGSGGAKTGVAGALSTAGTEAHATPDPGSGCSCNTAARNTPVPWHVLLAGLALASRRRRARG